MMQNNYQVKIAAEAIAAAIFARCGYDVSVQYGANQPEYDLMISRADQILKVSVKGSKDGSWGLTQTELSKIQKEAERKMGKKPTPDYHKAADEWLKKHSAKTIFCLVQYLNTDILQMPDVYLATPKEIANVLKNSSNGRGNTELFVYHKWTVQSDGAGTTDEIPSEWKFSINRLEELFKEISTP